MSIIKVEDIAHVRFRAPDLSQMAQFLTDFGLKTEVGDAGFSSNALTGQSLIVSHGWSMQ